MREKKNSSSSSSSVKTAKTAHVRHPWPTLASLAPLLDRHCDGGVRLSPSWRSSERELMPPVAAAPDVVLYCDDSSALNYAAAVQLPSAASAAPAVRAPWTCKYAVAGCVDPHADNYASFATVVQPE
eukprot:4560811-Prymnesium_polylepis.1